MTDPVDDGLLCELEPAVARLLDRHLATARDWYPHEWLPWSRGRDFAGPGGQGWTPEQSALGEPLRAAFELNLLTEDNLPSYHHELLRLLGGNGAWGEWVRRWTAEEARHASSLRDYVLLTRAVDPVALERDRMAAMQTGFSAGGRSLLHALAYAALQERATCIAHRNTGHAAGDPAGQRLLGRIAADEHAHMVFYRDLVGEAMRVAPGPATEAIADEVIAFALPGATLPGFMRRSVLIANAGIYDARRHRDEVLVPLLTDWALLPGDDAAEGTAQRLRTRLEQLELIASRFEQRRARRCTATPRPRA